MEESFLYIFGAIILPLFLFILKKVDRMERIMIEMLAEMKEVEKWVKVK